jgi:hypothetical protein
MRSPFEARWEKTIVLTSPSRRAVRAAIRSEHAASSCCAKNAAPISAGVKAKRTWSQ